MERKNIFDILREKINIKYQLDKIEDLLGERCFWGYASLEDLVNEYCFHDWKWRGRCISCEDMRECLGITYQDISNYSEDQDVVLNYLEYIVNLIWLCNTKVLGEETESYDVEYQYLQENVEGLIEDLGYEAKVLNEEERVLLIEKNPAAIAAAEIATSEVSYKIIEYNHFRLKGDIETKRNILLALADKFEPVRGELKKVAPTLESNVGYLLNKMNIRHNNKEGKNASEYMINISDKELEEWYDETYQMLLLSMLELDNIERNKKVAELKRKIGG